MLEGNLGPTFGPDTSIKPLPGACAGSMHTITDPLANANNITIDWSEELKRMWLEQEDQQTLQLSSPVPSTGGSWGHSNLPGLAGSFVPTAQPYQQYTSTGKWGWSPPLFLPTPEGKFPFVKGDLVVIDAEPSGLKDLMGVVTHIELELDDSGAITAAVVTVHAPGGIDIKVSPLRLRHPSATEALLDAYEKEGASWPDS